MYAELNLCNYLYFFFVLYACHVLNFIYISYSYEYLYFAGMCDFIV
jgi:hypothetical protein